MSPEDARALVLQQHERHPVNLTWMAGQLRTSKQNIDNWLSGTKPQNGDVWVQMARILGLSVVKSELEESAHDLALDVVSRANDEELRAKAANLLREIRKKYG